MRFAITIRLSRSTPLQFSHTLIYATLYTRRMLGPARRLTWHTPDCIRPSSVHQVNSSVTFVVSSVSLSRTPPLSRPRSNPNPAVVVATSATAAAANPTAVRRSRDPTTATQGARGYELELHRWWHQKGACPLLGCPNCHVPLIRIQIKQPNSLNEWFVKCPNNEKVRICSVF